MTICVGSCAPGVAAFDPVAGVRDGAAVATMDGDQVAVRPEAVHLGISLLVGIRTAGHHVHEVVEVPQPWPLRKALGRLHGKGMELEVRLQELCDRPVAGLVVEVQPEEPRAGQRRQDVLGGRLIVASRPSARSPARTSVSPAGEAAGGMPVSPPCHEVSSDGRTDRSGFRRNAPGRAPGGSGASSEGGSAPASAWATRRDEYGPWRRPFAPWPVTTQAFDHPGTLPTRARPSGEVGRRPTRVSM